MGVIAESSLNKNSVRIKDKYQFSKLKVGQSLYFKSDEISCEDFCRMKNAAYKFAQYHGLKFSCIVWPGDEDYKYEIARIK